MQYTKLLKTILVMSVFIRVFGSPAFSQTEQNYVKGKLITFSNNGFWCWFQDERAIIDTAKKKLIVGFVESGAPIDAVIYDLVLNKVESKTTIGRLTVDDHNAPGFLIRPDGKYIAMFADHYDKYNSHYCIYDGTKWSSEKKFDWQKIPGGTNYTIAYSNLMYLKSEGKIYNFARANNRSPNFLISTDLGETWKFGGQLSTDPSNSYNKGYYKYWGNGVDRIDFCCTEQHPRDYTTSIYHGYITGGKSYATNGTCADDNIFDQNNLPTCQKFTKVFANGTNVNGVSMVRCWQSDIMRYEDGTIAIIFKARANNSETDHRFFYARYDNKEWKWTYLGKAGSKLYSSEQDYIGLGALCPDDQNTIYLSTTFDPSSGSSVGKHEIFKGVTKNSGATWQWEAITKNSTMDNFRPIVPAWDKKHYALLWCRGSYSAAQQFNASVVGLIDSVTMATPVSCSNNLKGPLEFKLDQSCTNPFALAAAIRYSIPKNTFVDFRVYSSLGKEIAVLVNKEMSAGSHSVTWNVRNMPSGMYFSKISALGYSKVIQLRLM